jgi:hypothetical protein
MLYYNFSIPIGKLQILDNNSHLQTPLTVKVLVEILEDCLLIFSLIFQHHILDFDSLICSHYKLFNADIYFHTTAILWQQGFVSYSALVLRLVSSNIFLFGACLTLFCRYTKLGNHLPSHKTLFRASLLSLTLTHRGMLQHIPFSHFNPPRFTREASLVRDLSFTKMRGTSIEVIVIVVPYCVSLSWFGLGFSQTTNCAITCLKKWSRSDL